MHLTKANTYAAYSTRRVIDNYKGSVFTYTENNVDVPLAFGSNHWLSDREVTHANPESHNIALKVWYDQMGVNDLTVAATQVSPRMSTRNYQRLVNHKPTLTFTDGLGLTANNPVVDFRDVSVSFVVAVDYITASTLFNFTGENENRFQSHLPWINGTIYFDYGNSTNATNWRVNFPYDVPTGRFAVVTYTVNNEGASVRVNGVIKATGAPTESLTPTDRKFVLGAGNGIACASGNFTIGEVLITRANVTDEVIKSQMKYFNIT